MQMSRLAADIEVQVRCAKAKGDSQTEDSTADGAQKEVKGRWTRVQRMREKEPQSELLVDFRHRDSSPLNRFVDANGRDGGPVHH